MARLALGQKKSKIYLSIECCLRNLKPSNCLPCKTFHKIFSAGVALLRKLRRNSLTSFKLLIDL